eukprot:5418589-Prymnesium_polylepis.1
MKALLEELGCTAYNPNNDCPQKSTAGAGRHGQGRLELARRVPQVAEKVARDPGVRRAVQPRIRARLQPW